MSVSTPRLEQLKNALRDQISAISRYTDELELVKQALAGNDTEQITRQIDHASSLFQSLETASQACLQLLPVMGYPAQPSGLQQLVAESTDAQLAELKSSLDTSLSKLKHGIMVNDQLIRQSQQRVQLSIRVLTGHSLSPDGETYNASGSQQTCSDSQRILARA
jgi:hypothetical protein